MDAKNPKDIILGFQEDFNEVSEEFAKVSSNLDLKDFFSFWTENKLDCIFANRFDPRELLESIKEIYRVLVELVVNPSAQDDSHRIVALYFMLCLSVKQPDRFRGKIRLNCNDVVQVDKLCSANPQANFAWNQLKSMRAVDIVEDRTIYGPSMLNNRSSKTSFRTEKANPNPGEDDEESLRFLENRIEPTLLDLDSMCAPYEQIKMALKLNEYMDSTVDLVSEGSLREFINEAKHLLFDFKAESSRERVIM